MVKANEGSEVQAGSRDTGGGVTGGATGAGQRGRTEAGAAAPDQPVVQAEKAVNTKVRSPSEILLPMNQQNTDK